jgi:hypothetical protein
MATSYLNAESPEILAFLTAWHENGRAEYAQYYGLNYDMDAPKRAKDRKRYIACDKGCGPGSWSAAFMIDRASGMVYSARSYGLANRALGHVLALTRAYEAATVRSAILVPPGFAANDAILQRAAAMEGGAQ